MIKIGVIVSVEEPTEWVSSFVAVEKPDKSLRLCLDPRYLNKAVKRPDFRLPTTEEMITKIGTCKKFTKLDASCAYWQIPLDYESSLLTTFSTPFGRFRFIRMPYGITSASDICQQYIYEILEGIEGAANSQDDILIWGNDNNQLKQRTIQVFDAILASGMMLNPAKCSFHLTELVFLGHKITSNGILPDDYKIKAITEMVYPSTVKELQRFLGLVNYVGKFLPNLSEKTEALRQLLRKDVKFLLDENHKKEINELKQMITRAPVLKIFDPKLPTKISCDASSTGLGAVLEQQNGENWFPIAYSSRTLTSTEKNYCQLEKETLSILFACNKFHDYVYGRKFYVYNDHLPLKSIFNKNITKAPARIQRFMLRLQRYDFDLHYIKGSKLTVADALSRSSLKENVPEISEHEMSQYVHSILTTDFISENLLNKLRDETKKDIILQDLYKTIQEGWCQNKKQVKQSVQLYFKYRHELNIYKGVILKDCRIVVPFSMRKDMKKRLHSEHMGIVKTKQVARDSIYWPGIDKEIDIMIQNCEVCQIHQNKLSTESNWFSDRHLHR